MSRSTRDILTIGQLGKAAGVPTSTIRFYERRGLLQPDVRSPSNYRGYSPATVERLAFIRSAQASGFALNDVAEMLALTAADGSPCDDVAALIERRLADVRLKLRELKRVEHTLAQSLATLCKQGPDWCEKIVRMRHRTSPPGRARARRT